MVGSHEGEPCRLFDQAIYTYLISCRVGSGFRVGLSGQASQPDPTLFQKNSNPTRRGQSSSDPQPSSCSHDDVSIYDDWGRWTNGIANAANGASNSDPVNVNVNGNGWISGNGVTTGVTPNKAINGNGQPQANGA